MTATREFVYSNSIQDFIKNNKEKINICNLGKKRFEIQHDLIADKYTMITKHERTSKMELQLDKDSLKKARAKLNKLYKQTITELTNLGKFIPPMFLRVNENTPGIKSNKELLLARLDFLEYHKIEKQVLYTHGYSFMSPTIHNKPISIGDAKKIINEEPWWDAKEDKDAIYINTFSESDLY